MKEEIARVGDAKTTKLDSLTLVHSGGDRFKFPQEKTREWLTFLDVQQRKISGEIFESISSSSGYKLHLLLGGAGTGKTMVLRDLAYKMRLETGHFAQLRVPPGVRQFLLSEGSDIPGLPPFEGTYNAILLDDPITISDAIESIDDAKRLKVPIVIAIDPIQWHERRSIEKFEKLLKSEDPTEYVLSVNYRQGQKVGQPAIQAIKNFRLRTSEFTDRFREQINKSKAAKFEYISLDSVKFAEDAGTYAFYSQEEFTPKNILNEFLRVGRFVTERQWPKVLIGTETKASYPFGVPTLIDLYQSEVDDTFRFRQRAFSQYREVRGTEYEAVIIFIRRSTWSLIVEGLEGAKADDWELLNAPLTFLTRAENRCVVFEIPNDTKQVPISQADSEKLSWKFRESF
jgi:hypothetical protein